MKTFVLCLLFFQNGYHADHIPFHTKEACEKAAKWYERGREGIEAVCISDMKDDDPTQF